MFIKRRNSLLKEMLSKTGSLATIYVIYFVCIRAG